MRLEATSTEIEIRLQIFDFFVLPINKQLAYRYSLTVHFDLHTFIEK